MLQRSWYDISFDSDSGSRSISFFALSLDDARSQFADWWEYRNQYFRENLPLPEYHFRATYSAEKCDALDAALVAK